MCISYDIRLEILIFLQSRSRKVSSLGISDGFIPAKISSHVCHMWKKSDRFLSP